MSKVASKIVVKSRVDDRCRSENVEGPLLGMLYIVSAMSGAVTDSPYIDYEKTSWLGESTSDTEKPDNRKLLSVTGARD